MKKKLSKPSLQKKADQVFSLFIRNKYEKDGFVECITCLRSFPVMQIQAGHYIPRAKFATRYSEFNVHPQCLMCNLFKHGELPKYALFLLKTYGAGILDRLDEESSQLVKKTNQYFEEIINKYKL